MKITLAMVMSIDGKTTRGNDSKIYTWTSREDQAHFRTLISLSSAIIMGRQTFLASKDIIMSRLTSKTLRLVVTNHPEKYANLVVPGQLEFTQNQPQEIIDVLKSRGYTKALLVGGHRLNDTFFKSQLVDDLILTVEPNIFGLGNSLILGKSLLDITLKLISHKTLNAQGTLLLHYQIIK